ncbi:MAG: dihydroorotate dehydrogenase electron transfer subunit [Candidatus Bathyarchaeota archaeon]|nr:MAG: dihydroorotate dehydrogenase electron transfer subunit [Candidatus Bathyarchaeota archaeon]
MSASLTEINRLRITRIHEIKRESPTVKTFTFHDKLCSKARPGQFIMVWIPRVDEIPMSLSAIGSDWQSSMTVANVGEATDALHQKKAGDLIGVRGPYGNCFTLAKGNTIIVGGGTGLAPLAPLAEELAESPARVTFVAGAKTRNELLLLDRLTAILSRIDGTVITATEDGSHGIRGLATDASQQLLEKKQFDMIYTCGPEAMMYKMFFQAERYEVPLQASLERLMRCAIGICGSCLIGRFRVCREGPVFSSKQLREVKEEFGRYRRDGTGKKCSL